MYLNAEKDEKAKSGKRRQFSKLTKEKALKNQKNRCNLCGKIRTFGILTILMVINPIMIFQIANLYVQTVMQKKLEKNPENS